MKCMLLAKNNIPARNERPVHPCHPLPRLIILQVLLLIIVLATAVQVSAQENSDKQKEADYKKVVTERSSKIVNTLAITDSNKYYKVLDELVNQYTGINVIHDQAKTAVAEIKAKSLTKEEKDEAFKKLQEEKSSRLLQRHQVFIAHLKELLTDEQLETVKDGMTYRVLPVTYTAYQDMLLNLTNDQKAQIYTWLKEARELAMDEGSSEDKHKIFGKYKGRINNYLSAAGYDLKKETEAWQKRVKEKRSSDQ